MTLLICFGSELAIIPLTDYLDCTNNFNTLNMLFSKRALPRILTRVIEPFFNFITPHFGSEENMSGVLGKFIRS